MVVEQLTMNQGTSEEVAGAIRIPSGLNRLPRGYAAVLFQNIYLIRGALDERRELAPLCELSELSS